jgi:hypothetical protein
MRVYLDVEASGHRRSLQHSREASRGERCPSLRENMNGAVALPAGGGAVGASGGGGHLADIVAKVPNCPALIFLLLKNPTDDR